ncbi:pre-rRNA processing protein [Tilletia horrida]|nr:pre-rRNA processing protein [Tilletia horrida]
MAVASSSSNSGGGAGAGGGASMAALDAALAKLRHQAASQLESQRKPAQLLLAIEATLDEQHEAKRKRLATERSPTEYLIALQSMLGNKAASNVLGPTLYLLAIVTPHIQPATLLSQLSALLPALANVFSTASSSAATQGAEAESVSLTLRSALTVLESILLAHTATSTLPSLKKNIVLTGCWNTAVQLSLDVRPKIRKRAHDLVTATLTSSSATSHAHPYADSTAEWAVGRMESIISSGGLGSRHGAAPAGGKGKNSPAQQQQRATDFSFDKKTGQARNAGAFAAMRAHALQQGLGQAMAGGGAGGAAAAADAAASAGIWLCQLLKRIVKTFSSKSISPLAVVLLRLPALQNPFLTSAAFEVFDALFRSSSPPTDVASLSAEPIVLTKDTLSRTLQTLLEPSILPSDNQSLSPALLSAYLRALTGALTAYSRFLISSTGAAAVEAEQLPLPWGSVVPAVWGVVVARALDSKTAGTNAPRQETVRQSAAEALIACLRFGVPDAEVDLALEYVLSHGRHLAFPAPSGGPKADDRPFLVRVVAQLQDALSKHALRFANVVPELLDVITALVRRLGLRSASAIASKPKKGKQQEFPTAAAGRRPAATELVLSTLIPTIAELRTSPAFPARENADAVLSAAIQVIGPRQIVVKLPLGLLGENPDGQGRAWLLPLMRSSISNTELLHFVEELIPLSEKLFARKEEAAGKAEGADNGSIDPKQKQRFSVEAKMFEALVDQVWATFPAYCDLPYDLGIVLRERTEVISLLNSLLFSQPSLRPTVTRGLQRLLERNTALARSAAPKEHAKADFGLDQDEAKANLELLAKLAYQDTLTSTGNGGILANLMNVYSQTAADSRGFVLETIATFVEILPQEQVDKMYTRIVKMLKKGLPALEKNSSAAAASAAAAPVPHTMLDLLGALIPFLKAADAKDLFGMLHHDGEDKTVLLKNADAGVQKRTYKLLTRLVELRPNDVLPRGSAGGAAELIKTLNAATPSVLAGSKRGRIALFAALVPRIGADELHLLPNIVPEAVLATKETNQQCREESYELLVQMGRKMAEAKGGVIKRKLVDGDEEMAGGAEDGGAAANLTEYLAMVSAGLAGTSPHMISATITALSRLVYEFHEEIPNETLDELLSTLLVFLASANREIVKSSLGMVKVVIVAFPAELVDAHLPQLVELLLNGKSAQHKQHFKSKLRHIIERLMRKFGNERIESLADEENRKLVVNIRKRKERAKRKKAGGAEGGQEDGGDEEADGARLQAGVRAQKSHGMDAFEEALYGSDSDLSSDGEDYEASQDKRGAGRKNAHKKQQQDQTYILDDGEDEDAMPLDLLDRTAFASRVAAQNTVKAEQRRRQPGQEARKFNIEEGTGKMMIDDEDDDENGNGGLSERARLDAEAGAGDAFVRKQRGVDGFTVGKGGAVKFNKNNKRTREDEMELDAEAAGAEGDGAPVDTKAAAAIFAAAAAGADAGAGAGASKKKQKKEKVAIGAEFRAKKAGGDVSKNGQSPFAYVPLGQVASKKKGKGKGEEGSRLDITGKGKRGRA